MRWLCGCCTRATLREKSALLLSRNPAAAPSADSAFGHLKAAKVPGATAISVVVAWYLCNTLFFCYVEDWSWKDSAYFTSYTLTTVGYGDVSPKTVAGKVGTIVSLWIAMTIVTSCIGMVLVVMRRGDRTRMLEGGVPRPEYGKLAAVVVLLLVCVVIGTAFAMVQEGWTFLDAFYWAMVSVTAVGYGDLSMSKGTHLFCIFYLPIAVSIFGAAAALLVNLLLQIETAKRVHAFVGQGVTEGMIAALDQDKTGSVDKFEFCTYVLVGQGKLTLEDVRSAASLFEKLDKDGNGTIDIEDMKHQQLPV